MSVKRKPAATPPAQTEYTRMPAPVRCIVYTVEVVQPIETCGDAGSDWLDRMLEAGRETGCADVVAKCFIVEDFDTAYDILCARRRLKED